MKWPHRAMCLVMVNFLILTNKVIPLCSKRSKQIFNNTAEKSQNGRPPPTGRQKTRFLVIRRPRGGKNRDFWSSAAHGKAKITIFGHPPPTGRQKSRFLVISARKMTKKTEKADSISATLIPQPQFGIGRKAAWPFAAFPAAFAGNHSPVSFRELQAGQRVAASSALPRTHVRLHT